MTDLYLALALFAGLSVGALFWLAWATGRYIDRIGSLRDD